jgi:hypothetical protein
MKTEELLAQINQLKKDFDNVLNDYIGESMRVLKLERENSALKQRILDLEDLIEENKMNITHHKNGVITTLMDDKTAYKLADILRQSDFLAMDFAEDAANMLRQQADENKEINQENNDLRYLIAQQADRIAELEKQIKHWTTPCQPLCKPSVCDCIIPPTRQLSDEEICKLSSDYGLNDDLQDVIEFARAIEAKLKGQ